MKKSEIKKTLKRFDDVPMPAKEKMLPPEALVERSNTVRRERKSFRGLAAAGFAAVALVLAGALLVESVADKGGKSALTDNDSVLVNDVASTDVSSAPFSSEDNVVFVPDGTNDADVKFDTATEDMPIISCGKYSSSSNAVVDSFVKYYTPGNVYFETMHNCIDIDMDELEDDVLYAVCFKSSGGNKDTAKNEKVIQLKQEQEQRKIEFAEEFLAGIPSECGKDGLYYAVKAYLNKLSYRLIENANYYAHLGHSCDYLFSIKCDLLDNEANKDILEWISDNLVSDSGNYNKTYGKYLSTMLGFDDYNKFLNEISSFMWYGVSDKYCECDEVRDDLNAWCRTMRIKKYLSNNKYYSQLNLLIESLQVTAKESMNEYLESLNIQFYEKNVYVTSTLDNETILCTLDYSDGVYPIAFLTKEQIKSLEASEDFALIVTLVYDELAAMDNEPVVLRDCFSCIDS